MSERFARDGFAVTSGLAAGYDGRAAITDVTIDVRRGERLALLGPNGGGKTTLFRALLGSCGRWPGPSTSASVPAPSPRPTARGSTIR